MRNNTIASVLLLLLMALAAWPTFVFVNIGISFFTGEGSVVDLWNQEPKRKLIDAFINGYIKSAVIAIALGLVAVIDFQLLSKHKYTGYIAGILIPLFCIAIAYLYYADPNQVLLNFILTGLVLWILYKIIDIGLRIRRAY